MKRGLNSYEMRAALTVLFGAKFVAPAANALDVRKTTIQWWCDPDQDQSDFCSGPGAALDVEDLLRDAIQDPDKRLAIRREIDAMSSALAWVCDVADNP